MAAKSIPFPFSAFTAGPLAMPSIKLAPGDPSLAQDREEPVCLPESAQMPDTIHGDLLLPFLRRVGEGCLFVARAKPPVVSQLSDLLTEDNTGPVQGRLNLNGRKPSDSR